MNKPEADQPKSQPSKEPLKPNSHHRQQKNPLQLEKARKLAELKAMGVEVFPHSFKPSCSAEELLKKYDAKLQAGEKPSPRIEAQIAGRIVSMRKMGKAAFFHLQDEGQKMQCYVRMDELNSTEQQVFALLETGDFVGAGGFVFKTRKNELSLHVEKLKILCKSLQPLPEKFHGLSNIETRYRHRHLDMISNLQVRQVFLQRAHIIKYIREFLNQRGFVEVDIPALQPTYGGAEAQPFKTRHRALGMDLYLKISPELYLKRLIVGGMHKVYDLSKNFRNEGIDRSHNPEFMMLEWYEAYTCYLYQMEQFEQLVAYVAKKLRGSLKLKYQGQELDFAPPWKRVSVREALLKKGLNVETMQAQEIAEFLQTHCNLNEQHFAQDLSWGHMVMEAFELLVEQELWQPCFIVDFPLDVSPLTKKHRDPALSDRWVERFEPYAAGMELGNAYTELNDPEDQRARLEEQEQQRKKDKTSLAHPMDKDFLHAIETGMPPTGGVGLGVERLVMLLTDQNSIRDTIPFPTLRNLER